MFQPNETHYFEFVTHQTYDSDHIGARTFVDTLWVSDQSCYVMMGRTSVDISRQEAARIIRKNRASVGTFQTGTYSKCTETFTVRRIQHGKEV